MESISSYAKQKEYIVSLWKLEDLDSFYEDMETPGGDLYIPDRVIHCADRRPVSRNTHYMLSDWEAEELKGDSRVRSVELHPRYLGIKAGSFSSQTSDNWNKSGSTSNAMRNWGLLRCYEGQDRSGWGSDGTVNQTGTIKLDSTGKNVDVVIIDDNGLVDNHPEYAVNADGTGGSRYNEYNWFQHDPTVKGTAPGTYPYSTGSHSTHVAGTVAGTTQGWARDANIYNIFYLAGSYETDYNFPYVMDYVREFHRTKSVNTETGRKNPTITNNSWGMSIFPSEWTFNDITAVTYRGTRFTPSGSSTFTGFSGVCTSNTRLATLVNFENSGNRITTTGPYTPPSGAILTKPASWDQTGQQASLTILSVPDASYEVTVQGPAEIDLINNVALDAISGSMSLSSDITIRQGSTVVETYTDGPYSTTNGGTIETNIRPNRLTLPDNAVYTITFNTNLDTSGAGNVLYAVAMSLTVVTESTPATATVSSLSTNLLGATSLTASTTPSNGNNDDGVWALNLPFDITFLGTNYSTIYVGTNHYVTFGGGSSNYASLSATNPNLPKIMWCAADNSVQRIYYGVEGVSPNRTYRVRIEGNASTTGTVGSPGMVCEYTFYESTPTQIDLQLGVNNRKSTGGSFTTEQLNSWGFIAGQRIPKRVDALDADIEDAITDGIIYVGAAGNGRWKHDVPGGADWNNTFEMAIRYPDSVTEPYHYMRGTSPTANDTTSHPDGVFEIPNICVGSIDVTTGDYKASYSDCGPGVDIWAPGTSIISSYTGGVSDIRNSNFLVGKISGTSMASPQVCGVLACALEQNPHWNQIQAKQYITGVAKQNQITATTGGPADFTDLQGAPNKYLYYKRTRADEGITVPKNDQGTRPTSGQAWPRPKIYRFGST
jgi:hypothetical protein